tara:strand:+ start:519 stop:662 length:144 start_codon:yes stop_codon:yes gene_type:complete
MFTAPVLLGDENARESSESFVIGIKINVPDVTADTAWGTPLTVVAIM